MLQKLTKTEEEAMQIIWDLEEAFVKDIIDQYPDPKPPYNTVSSVVRILESKGFVDHRAYGRTYQYFPIITKEAYSEFEANNLVSKYFDGSVSKLVSMFARSKKADAEELKRLLDELENKK
jgi:predicted transcriptional regulator